MDETEDDLPKAARAELSALINQRLIWSDCFWKIGITGLAEVALAPSDSRNPGLGAAEAALEEAPIVERWLW